MGIALPADQFRCPLEQPIKPVAKDQLIRGQFGIDCSPASLDVRKTCTAAVRRDPIRRRLRHDPSEQRMAVGIDEFWHEHGLAEIADLRVGRRLPVRLKVLTTVILPELVSIATASARVAGASIVKLARALRFRSAAVTHPVDSWRFQC